MNRSQRTHHRILTENGSLHGSKKTKLYLIERTKQLNQKRYSGHNVYSKETWAASNVTEKKSTVF